MNMLRDMLQPTRRNMLRGMFTSTSALTRFAVNGVEAALALDFIGGEYRTGNTATTFADAFTGTSPKLTYSTAAGSNSTMVNSAGEIVWAPHNLVTYSNDLTSWSNAWSGGVTLTPDDIVGPDGVNSLAKLARIDSGADGIFTSSDLTAGLTYTVSFVAKAGTSTSSQVFFYDLGALATSSELAFSWGSPPTTTSSTNATNIDYADLGGGFYRISFSMVPNTTASHRLVVRPAIPGTSNEYIHFGQVAVYRSDLGGMAPVPGAEGDFQYYVPTNGNAEYLPRVGHHVYNGSTWVNEGLLIESEARSNLIPYSDFSGGSRIPTGIKSGGFVPNSASGLDGTTSATVLIEDASTGGHRIDIGGFSITSGVVYTASVYAKPNGRNEVRLTENATTGAYASFNVETGAIVSSGLGGSGLIENAGGGWYRCAMTFTSAGTNGRIDVNIQSSGSVSYTGDDTSGLYLYGLQLDQGQVVNGTPVDAPTPSSYMPTNGGTYTRTAQSLTVPAHWYDVDNPTYTGPELVTNGDFSNGTTGWAGNNATLSLSSGRLRVTDNGSSAYAYQVLTVEPGKTYKLTFDCLFPSANTATDYEVNIRNTNQSGSILKGLNTGTTTWVEDVLSSNSMTFTPTTSTVGLTLASSSTTGDYADFDNISVRQVSAPQFGWPEPEYIGPELVTASSDLVPQFYPAEWTLGVGSASVTGISSNDRLWLFGVGNTNLLPAGTYNVSYTIGAGTDRLSGLYFDGAYISTSSTAGDKSVTFTTDGTRQSPFFFLNAGGNLYLTNISVREINPLSVSIQMDGRMTYADEGVGVAADGITSQVVPFTWLLGASDYIYTGLSTSSTATGVPVFVQEASGTVDSVSSASPGYTPGVNVPFNISSRHGSTFINGAVDGVALTEDTTPTALPDLSGTNLQIAYDFMGTIGTFRQFAGDIGDTGLVTATNPSTEPTLSLTFDGTAGSFYNLEWSE